MTAVDHATGEVMATGLWLDQAVGHHIEGDLDTADAGALTAKIKAYAGVTWVLLYAAHERKAHKALGYATWEDYVRTEFDMSRSRSYQLISQAKVVMEISAAVSTDVDISEAEARDLAPALDEAKNAAAKAVESLPEDATPEDKGDAVRDALDGVRQSLTPKREPSAKSTTTERVTETRQTVDETPTPKQQHDDIQASSETTWADVVTTYPQAVNVPPSDREGIRRGFVQLQTMSGPEKVKREAALLNAIDTALLTPQERAERRAAADAKPAVCPTCHQLIGDDR